PRAVLPIELRPLVAARARRGIRRLELAADRLLRAAPRAADHRLRDRSRAVSALVPRLEHGAVLALELAEKHLPPQRRILGAVRLARRAFPLQRAVTDPLELVVHHDRVLVAVLRTDGDGAPQPLDELGLELRANALDTLGRPRVRPLDQMPREQLVDHEPEGEHVRL